MEPSDSTADTIGLVMILLIYGIPFVLFVVAGIAGAVIERRHYRSIRAREAATAGLPAITLRTLTDPRPVAEARLVTSSIVISHDNFKRAIVQIRKARPDCAILDYNMPGANGLEVFLESKRWSPSTRFILLTGSVSAATVAALVEAGIDFSDEGDVSAELIAPALKKIATLKSEIEETLGASAQSERLREGLTVAIAGPPNAGKSTLLNRLARREAAIVSPHAGTTRDIIEVHLDLDGYPVTVIDTAGVRDTVDPVEQEGVRRARDRARTSDLVLWLVDASDEAASALASGDDHAPVWIVRNKVDLVTTKDALESARSFDISAANGEGVPELISALVSYAGDYFGSGEMALVSRVRHRTLLREVVDALARAEQAAREGDELLAEELRIAIHSLGRLTGRVDVEDILDVIFREFCIGK